MGARFSATSHSDSVTVNAPASVLWEVVSDLRILPQVLSMVVRVDGLDDGPDDEKSTDANSTKIGVGTRFVETRQYPELNQNATFLLHKSVTGFETEHPYSLSLNVSTSEGDDTDDNGATNTSTLTVYESGNDDDCCILVGSLAAMDSS